MVGESYETDVRVNIWYLLLKPFFFFFGYWGGAIKVYVYFIRRELLLKWPKNEKWKEKKNHCYFGVSSSRNLAKTPPLAFLGQSQPVVGSMWKNEQFFGDLNFHKSEPHQHQSCKN